MRRFNIIMPGRSYWLVWLMAGVLLGFSIAGRVARGSKYRVNERAKWVVIEGPNDFHLKIGK